MSTKHKEAVRALHGLFDIRELVTRSLYESFPAETLWSLFDTDLLLGLAWVKRRYNGPIWINTWCFGGSLDERGFRPSSSKEGATLSGHKLGKSLDLGAKDLAKLREICMKCPYFTEIEDSKLTPTWVHISTRAHMMDGLRIIGL